MKKFQTSMNILVIEDNTGDLFLIQDYLEEHIKEPIITNTGCLKDALQILQLKKTIFDIILLDLSLPDKSGKEVIEAINAINCSAPIIVLTGYSNMDFSIDSLSLGIADYLIKDEINSLSLYKSIIYSIERKKIQKELLDSEEKYSNLFQLSPQPMFVYHKETLEFISVNEAAKKTYGYNTEEFLSKKITDLFDTSNEPIRFPTTSNIEENGIKLYGCHLHRKKNLSLLYVEMRGYSINFNNIPAEVIVSNDITEISNHLNTVKLQNEQLKEIAWIQSHIVRAPLARMMSIIDILKYPSIQQSEKDELMKYLLDSSLELDTIIRDITNKAHDALNLDSTINSITT
jgi:PAS domain S-box-containing protein